MVMGVRVEGRLRRLEKRQGELFDDVEGWISQGRYYDELTDQERTRYDRYKVSLGGVDSDKALCALEHLMNDNEAPPDEKLHFRLTPRTKPPTREEHEQRIMEIQEILYDTKG